MKAQWRDEWHLWGLMALCPGLAAGLAASGVLIGQEAVWKVLAVALLLAVPAWLVYALGFMLLFDWLHRWLHREEPR